MEGPCETWTHANISLCPASGAGASAHGRRSATAAPPCAPGEEYLVVFDGGHKSSGRLDNAGAEIDWFDGSSWGRYTPTPSAPVTVHVCPTTHMDPGWFQTADELYEALFRETVSNVTVALNKNQARTYTAEIVVVWQMYIGEFGAVARDTLAALVAERRLEFAGAGWVQPDEAITRFEDIVDQQTLGHLWLQSVLGHPPVRVGWSADPFGHSSTFAFVAGLNAYDAHVIGRPMSPMDPVNNQSSVVWHPMASMRGSGPGFDPASSTMAYDNLGYWEPYRSMKSALNNSDTASAAGTLDAFARAAASRSPQQRPRNVLVMLGDDAPMQNPWATAYDELDKVLALLNARSSETNFTFKYSTPSAWVKALAAEGAPLPSRTDWDMLPLVGNEFPYWVGYYTSRPEFKQIYHDGSAFFRGASMLHALASDDRTWLGGLSELATLWRALGLAQHHDIITGDCWDRVAEDNGMRVRAGVANAAEVASAAVSVLAGSDGVSAGAACTNWTLSPCPALVAALESRAPTTVTFFNPLAWARTETVSLLSPSPNVSVTDAQGRSVASQTAPYSAPDLPSDTTWSSLAFSVTLPPLGTASVVLTAGPQPGVSSTDAAAERIVPSSSPSPPSGRAAAASSSPRRDPGEIVLSNKRFSAVFTPNGTLTSATLDGVTVPVVARVMRYSSKAGSENQWDFSTDGVDAAADLAAGGMQKVLWHTSGELFDELAVSVNARFGVSVRYRVSAGEPFMHVFTGTGPFPANASNATSFANATYRSTDAIVRFETGIASGGAFFTDSNGLELVERRRWSRPFVGSGVNYTGFAGPEPVAINMYPVTSAALLADADPGSPALAVATANSHGCTSMSDGAIEIMVNRRVVRKDPYVLTDLSGNRLVTQHNLLLVGATRAATATAVRAAAAAMSNPLLAFASAGGDPAPSSSLAAELPPELALVSLQLLPPGLNMSDIFLRPLYHGISTAAPPPASSGVLLARLRHIHQLGLDDPTRTVPVMADLAKVFAPRWRVVDAVEMTVDASEAMAEAQSKRVAWPVRGHDRTRVSTPPRRPAARGGGSSTLVTLAPMELKTFVLRLA